MNSNSLGQRERKVGKKGGRDWASGNLFIVNPRHDNCTLIDAHSEKSAHKPPYSKIEQLPSIVGPE